MHIVEPYAKIIRYMSVPGEGVYDYGEEAVRFIEETGRKCYRSEGTSTLDSYKHFVGQHALASRHTSMLRFSCVVVDFMIDRGVAQEITRHGKTLDFQHECVAGTTKLSKTLTIKEAYNRQGQNEVIKSAGWGRVIPNWIRHVFYKGKAPVFDVTTSLGYKIRCTSAHAFQVPGETFTPLADLQVGSLVMVNGRPALLAIPDEKLRAAYLDDQLSPLEIADTFGAPYRSVLRRLKTLGIFEKHINDKNPEKYQHNHTAESQALRVAKRLELYQQGWRPWNLGLDESDPRVKNQADALRANHYNNAEGAENSNWNGGNTPWSYMRLKGDVKYCEFCGRNYHLHVHHIDKDRSHNNIENLIKLCRNCHKKMHTGWWVGMVTHADSIVSIEPAGEEDVYDLEMEDPFHNYVADGFVVHNSQRYCNYSKGKFGNSVGFIKPRDLTTIQDGIWTMGMSYAETYYFDMLKAGCKPQIAADLLPRATASLLSAVGNFQAWRHFLLTRTTKQCHPKLLDVTIEPDDAMLDLIHASLLNQFKQTFPIIFDDIEPAGDFVENMKKAR